jgi:hypothetical protein
MCLPILHVASVCLQHLLIVPHCILVLLRLHVGLGPPEQGLGVVRIQLQGLVTVSNRLCCLLQLGCNSCSVKVQLSVGGFVERINLESIAGEKGMLKADLQCLTSFTCRAYKHYRDCQL